MRRAPTPAWVPGIVLRLLGPAGFYVDLWLVARLRSLIVLLLGSLFLAFALEPAANSTLSFQRSIAPRYPPPLIFALCSDSPMAGPMTSGFRFVLCAVTPTQQSK